MKRLGHASVTVAAACLAISCLFCGCTGTPTPGADAAGKFYTATPLFNPPPGTYPAAVTVQITCTTEGAAIYYTTDGSQPSDTNGTLYTQPVQVSATTTLQACAYTESALPSIVNGGVYTIASNAAPVLSNAMANGSIRPGQTTQMTVSCVATDTDGYVTSVTADLTSLGGSASQALFQGTGNLWSWTGGVRPGTPGSKTIRLTAMDDQGAVVSTTVTITAVTPLGTEKWRYTSQGPILSSPAMGPDGTIYVGSSDRYLYAISPDGTQKWRLWASSPVTGCPAVGADGMIYFGTSGMIYAVSPSGSVVWTAPISGSVYGSVALGARGTICAATGEGTVAVVNSDGSLRWQTTIGAGVESSPSVDSEGTIYLGAFDGKLYAIYPNRQVKWTFSTGATILASPAIGPDGTIYIGSTDNRLYAVKPDGTAKWTSDRGGMVLSSPALAADGTLYVGSSNARLAAFNADTGALKWEFVAPAAVASPPAIAQNGTIYFGCSDGTLCAVDAAGKERWRLHVGGQAVGSPLVGQDGTVYAPSADRNLYAIAGDSAAGTGPWPTFRGNQRRTGAAAGLPPSNVPPIIGGATVASVGGSLVQGRPGNITFRCKALDPDVSLAAVKADLSDLSGPTDAALAKGANDQWSGSATVTPSDYGTRTVRLVAVDSDNETRQATATLRVLAPPQVTDLSLTGRVVRKQDCAITVTCVCNDPDGTVQAVTADLSAVGVPGTQSLQQSGGAWTWSGTANAQLLGQQTITASVTDNEGLISQATAKVTVLDAEPIGTADPVVGTLIEGRDCTVTVSCAASDSDGTVDSVSADLSAIGGSAAQNLPYNAAAGKHTWTGTVHPLAWGPASVTITITDNDGVSTATSTDVTVLAPPAIPADKIEVSGTLTGKSEKTITVSCVALDPDGTVQAPVTVDLSAIGGSPTQDMTLDTNPARAAEGWYTCTVTLTPPFSGDKKIRFRATDNDGLSSTLDWQVRVINVPPTLGMPLFQGPLGADQACLVTVACIPADIDGNIATVKADLTQIGGGIQNLSADASGTWGWTGMVHPAAAGKQSIGLTVTDNIGDSVSGSFQVNVLRAPEISGQQVTPEGEIIANQLSTITVSCTASGLDNPVQTVLADLAWLGGSSAQVIPNAGGDTFSWTGEVLPNAMGDMVITFTAIDSLGFSSRATTSLSITRSLPFIWDVKVTGTPQAGMPAAVSISCQAFDASGIDSVWGNLRALGVPAMPAFNLAGGRWVWSGTVQPAGAGDQTIYLTATSKDGLSNTLQTTVKVYPGSPWASQPALGGILESSPAVAADGTIYIGSYDKNLYAVNPDGSVKWARLLGGAVQSSPAIGPDGTVYVGSGDGKLYAVASDNTVRWTYTTGGRVYSSPAVSADGLTVYVGSDDGKLHAVRTADGLKAWPAPYPATDKIASSPAVAPDGTIYFGSHDKNLYALNPNGILKWTCPMAGLAWSSPAIGPAPTYTVYIASFGPMPNGAVLYAVDPATGAAAWSLPLGGLSIYSSPVVGPDGTIYIGTDSDLLVAVDPSGSRKWDCPLDGQVRSVPLVGSSGMVYAGTNAQTLYAIDTATGLVSWTFPLGAEIRSSPALAPDGTLYVGCYDARLYAINAADTLAPSSWPMFRGSLRHTGRAN